MTSSLKTSLLTLALALVALPGAATAQYPKPDSGKMGLDSSHRGGTDRSRHAMMHTRRGGLTGAQIRELQAALAREGCDPGGIDGRMGPQTRRAIACARREKGINGNNANELLRALGLGFTVADSTGMGGLMRAGASPRRRTETAHDMGRDRMLGHDSAMVFDSSAARRGRGAKFKEKGRDTMPPGRTPR